MLDEYVQQWSAIQTVRAANLRSADIFVAYFSLTGDADEFEVAGYLSGLVMLRAEQRDLLAHAVNELLDSTGSTADGAYYSNQDAASFSGYRDYLRDLELSPDGYDFSAPPAGDHSTSTEMTAPNPVEARDADGGAGDAAEFDDSRLDEAEFRLVHALYESGLLDTGAEERFDRTRRARDHFGVSSASIALITEDAQVIKSVVGPIGQDLPRGLALCARTIERDRTLVIPEASLHPEWRDHDLVVLAFRTGGEGFVLGVVGEE